MSDERPKGPRAGELSRISAEYMGHGLTMAMATLLFLLVGWWLDHKVHTTPVLTILGAFVGAGAGFYRLYYHVVIEPSLRSRNGSEDNEDGG